ncbi:MAG TPA: translation elongation factor 4 [Candidatus Kapabacteria bacterium]|jgi:GTP-binding protein LepA|nr:elongation factor 4 [Ignavibacteria bacterium]HRE58154.1 translation elongation factor 4 [Candidatus Kapabacteria bacterium]HRI30103.1 translation elongation factor 4 [Candidatus Kapabacteria bacterium]HRK58427.1 translation elongation factor 4 [Candidatus Kapabacteria bacterium]
MKNFRNFCIIAHIDHGKSTLADRLLEFTGRVSKREMVTNQILDDNPLEQERGITIKLHAIQMEYKAKDGETYILNLIDTPGHVDFSYEVSRSLAACEGALLVVDATQGVEAQTISNLFLAVDGGLEIIPVINKIDLPSAVTTIDGVKQEVSDLLGCSEEEMLLASAKQGIGIEDILEAIVARIPPPKGDPNAPLKALIYDSIFDSYRGVIVYMRVFEGTLREKDRILLMATNQQYDVEEVGVLYMKRERTGELSAGNVGYLTAAIRKVQDTKVGDTVTLANNRCDEPISGFKEVKPMVFSGIYPADSDGFEELREALGKLAINDSAITYEPESSTALGFGFRCGFLGLLHMEIVQERLEREFNQVIVTTVPNVRYNLLLTNGEEIWVENPAQMPAPTKIEETREPFIKAQIITPSEYVGAVIKLCMDRRGTLLGQTYLTPTRLDLSFELPLAEVVFDFYDKLKSLSRGYASLDYEMSDYRSSELVKLDILLNGDPVDALSSIVHRQKAHDWGKKLCSKLKELIPRQMFEVAIQAAIGQKIVARDTISAMRKNVLAKCYGGDISRKRKLLEKQKEGKKRMKQVGRVEIPQEAFLAVLSID